MVNRRWFIRLATVIAITGSVLPSWSQVALAHRAAYPLHVESCTVTANITLRQGQIQAVAQAQDCAGSIEVGAHVQADGRTQHDVHTGQGDLRAEAILEGTSDVGGCAYVKVDGVVRALSQTGSQTELLDHCRPASLPYGSYIALVRGICHN